MSRFQLWLLRRLIRRAAYSLQDHIIINELWEAHRVRFYEDNIGTRYENLSGMLAHRYMAELDQIRRDHQQP